ncbi:MAG: alpha-L-fucosidase [Planctomycetota bacterium]|jgi:alpha-L-fucosidase
MRNSAVKICVGMILLATACGGSLSAKTSESCKEVTKYEATWESLKQYEVPEWFKDDKFGIFIHWGVYAVPAYGNEWYPRNMYIKDPEEQNITSEDEEDIFAYHRRTWGDQKTFGYKDFVPLFKAEKWDPDEWAELFKKTGARFVVPVAEHHDGFAMYDSNHTRWNSAKMGPKRDIVGDLGKALKQHGIKLGASTHYAYNWHYYTHSKDYDTGDTKNWDLYGKPHSDENFKEFQEHWYARTVDIVDKYEPWILWFDFGFVKPEYKEYRKKIAAHYYNKGLEWGKGVVLQFKYDKAYPYGTAVLDLERGKLDSTRPMAWQTDTSVSNKSWGYVENDDFKTVDSLVDDLVDIVSKNGVLLLNVGPKADGTIPDEAVETFLGIGEWLKMNGEAIYETRPWHTYGEGPTKIHGGDMGEAEGRPEYTGEDIRFTTKGNVFYAICLAWPGEQVTIKSLGERTLLSKGQGKIKDIRMLGSSVRLEWERDDEGVTVELPEVKPCDYAQVLKITLDGDVIGVVK